MGKIFKSKPAQITIGSISGVMGGMFAMPGPPLVLYCVSTLEDKREYVTTLQAFSVVFNVFILFSVSRPDFIPMIPGCVG